MSEFHDSENHKSSKCGSANPAAAPRLKVVDFTRYMPGPVASRVLADLGADVVKVENPRTGDATRGFTPLIHERGMFHVCLNPGKRSMALDTKSPEWPVIMRGLARWADVFLVGGLPDGLRKLGIDFDTLTAANPSLVYCNVTGYGEEGPMRAVPAHGLNPDAMAGLVPIEWRDGFPFPQKMFQSIGAPLSGVFAALGILEAVRRRDATGQPQRLGVSLLDSALWFNWRHMATVANLGHRWFDYSDFGGRYATYETSDGGIILVCPIEKAFWQAFCDLLDLPAQWRERGTWGASEMDHGMDYPEERAVIAQRMRLHTRAHWERELARIRIPFTAILSTEEAMVSEQARVNGAMREVTVRGKTARIPSMPVRFAGERAPKAAELVAPELGEHTDEVLRELGIELSARQGPSPAHAPAP